MIGEAQQAHDDNGNLTDDGELSYEWDAFNRLVRVMDGATTVATYVYDPQNRRVAKHVPAANDVYYSYDGWRTLGEYASATAANPDRQFVFGVYLDEPLVMDVNSDPDSTCTGAYDDRYFYHHNWQYSVIALSDSNGNLVEGYSYNPYGKHLRFYNGGSEIGFDSNDTITAMTASDYGNPFTYTGQRYDDETGLHYYKRRPYDALGGRFIGRDPIAQMSLDEVRSILNDSSITEDEMLREQRNLYLYCLASPLIADDPYGLRRAWDIYSGSISFGVGALGLTYIDADFMCAYTNTQPWTHELYKCEWHAVIAGLIANANFGTIGIDSGTIWDPEDKIEGNNPSGYYTGIGGEVSFFKVLGYVYFRTTEKNTGAKFSMHTFKAAFSLGCPLEAYHVSGGLDCKLAESGRLF